jgi:hypothetical protein
MHAFQYDVNDFSRNMRITKVKIKKIPKQKKMKRREKTRTQLRDKITSTLHRLFTKKPTIKKLIHLLYIHRLTLSIAWLFRLGVA